MKIEKAHAVFFSPTGTTEKVATAFASGTGIPFQKTDLTTVKARKTFSYAFPNNELAIVGLPVYGGRLPHNIDDFFQGLKGDGTPAVAIVVYGNREYEDALIELKMRLENCGFIVIGAATFIGEHTFSPNVASGRPDINDIASAHKFGGQIARMMKDNIFGKLLVKGNHPFTVEGFNPTKSGGLTAVALITTDDKCNACGLCAENCPWEAIDMQHYQKIDYTKCMRCFRCIKICPAGARAVREPKFFELLPQFETRLNMRRKEPELFLSE